MNSERIDAYLSDELDEIGCRRLESALEKDAALRAAFIQQAQTDALLRTLLADADGRKFAQGVIARLQAEGAEERSFAKSVLLEIVEEREKHRPVAWPDIVAAVLISAAASIGLLLLFQSIIFRGSPRSSTPAKNYVAHIERSQDLVWRDAKSHPLTEDGWLEAGPLHVRKGNLVLAFNSGATVTVEGPSELSIESGNRLFLKSGSLVAEVPDKAHGFTVNTPRLNAVDLGTRFGLRVEEDGTSDLHVMEGTVAASRTTGNTVATIIREGSAIRADARTRSPLEPVEYAGDTFLMHIGTKAGDRPALRYEFDESGGSVIEDSGVSRRFDVTLVPPGELDRSPRRTVGRKGGGLVFKPGENIEIDLPQEFQLGEPHTIALWLRLPATSGTVAPDHILEYGSPAHHGWKISANVDEEHGVRGAMRIDCGDGRIVGSTDLADGNWHHIAYRYLGGRDFVSRIHLFVDGNQETISYANSSFAPEGGAERLRIGSNRSDGTQGWIDSMSVFRSAISTTELQRLSR